MRTVRTTAIGKRRYPLALLWPAEDMKMSQPQSAFSPASSCSWLVTDAPCGGRNGKNLGKGPPAGRSPRSHFFSFPPPRFNLCLFICVSACRCPHVSTCPWRPCEPSDIGAGDQTWVLRKSKKCSCLLSLFSSANQESQNCGDCSGHLSPFFPPL